MRTLAVFTLMIVAVTGDSQSECSPGWFGALCQYKCRCTENKCDPLHGLCIDGAKCEQKWFGPACQFYDLAQELRSNRDKSVPRVTDKEETTCLHSNITGILLEWSVPYHIKWLRVYFQDSYFMNRISVKFMNNGTSQILECPNIRTAEVSSVGMDIHCDLNVTVKYMFLTGDGVGSLCSVYVSGGRNVALKQNAQQSSDLGPTSHPEAWHAVDGNTDGQYFHESCTHTDQDDTRPHWNLTFSQNVTVNRYVLYNRDEGTFLMRRLQGFELQSFDSQEEQVFKYKDTMQTPQLKYTVTSVAFALKSVTIKALTPDEDTGHIQLTLCEVEMYGDSVCPLGMYGRECEHQCNCAKKDDQCFSSTGGCPSGCSLGYRGESCDKKCDKGWFGLGCQYKCHCTSDTCDAVDGSCAPSVPCQLGWFGPACQYVDLAQDKSPIFDHFHQSILFDGNDNTCIDETIDEVSVAWSVTYPFTWMRIYFQDSGAFEKISIQFRETRNSMTLNCTNMQTSLVSDRALDVYCDLGVRISQVILTGSGVRSMCSLYISGGRNVAVRQRTKQSSTYQSSTFALSMNAIDGNKDNNYWHGSCSHTDVGDRQPTWTLSLLKNLTVNRYVIYNRDEGYHSIRERLQGFIISSLDREGVEVFRFKDTSPTVDTVYTVTLDAPFPQVSLVNIQAVKVDQHGGIFLQLCEVQVYGDSICELGRYGLDCEQTCNCANKSEQCFVSTGGCPSGCAAGFFGESCSQACGTETQSQGCGFSCPKYCRAAARQQQVCYQNRTCIQGCQPGYRGNICYEQCENGTYGADCNSTCSTFCNVGNVNKQICHHVDGTCLQGCKTGYKGPKCNESCDGQSYGLGCKLPCPQFCETKAAGPVCDNIHGTCLQGCQPGYDGEKCEEICDLGLYGQNCSLFCPINCWTKNDTESLCHHIHGTCIQGCKRGYKGSVCNESCRNGSYGQDCKSSCSNFCKVDVNNNPMCDYISGRCLQGCKDGYQGEMCDAQCDNGQYGTRCESLCPVFCGVTNSSLPMCHHISGTCLQGCHAGYQGPLCDEPCEHGTYGPECNFTCSEFCEVRNTDKPVCHIVKGKCLQGCKIGFRGLFCNETCENGKYGKDCNFSCPGFCEDNNDKELVCHHISGNCFQGCSPGYLGEMCDKTCEHGTYGPECSFTCSEFCEVRNTDKPVCHNVNGICLQGCQNGFRGLFCNETCKNGTFGPDCSSSCPEFCDVSNGDQAVCHHVNGSCLQGCKAGHHGPMCTAQECDLQTCQANSKVEERSSPHFNYTALIVSLCVLVAVVSAVGVFLWWRRRRMNRELFAFNSGNMRTESLENIVKTEMTDADSSNI